MLEVTLDLIWVSSRVYNDDKWFDLAHAKYVNTACMYIRTMQCTDFTSNAVTFMGISDRKLGKSIQTFGKLKVI